MFVCVVCFAQRQAERVELEKLQRQNAVLTSLCKELKAKNASAPPPVEEVNEKQQTVAGPSEPAQTEA